MLQQKKYCFKIHFMLIILLIGACGEKSAVSGEPGATIVNSSLPGVQDSTPSHDNPIIATSDEAIILGDTRDFPKHCSPHEIAELVLQFFNAYNDGDQEQLAEFFEPKLENAVGMQGWYSDSLRERDIHKEDIEFVSSNRNELLAYFAERHGQRERFWLRAISVSGPGWHQGMDIIFAYLREADDYDMARRAVGKGVVLCSEQKFAVWSSGAGPNDWESDFDHLNAGVSCAYSFTKILPNKIVICGKLNRERCQMLSLCETVKEDE